MSLGNINCYFQFYVCGCLPVQICDYYANKKLIISRLLVPYAFSCRVHFEHFINSPVSNAEESKVYRKEGVPIGIHLQ